MTLQPGGDEVEPESASGLCRVMWFEIVDDYVFELLGGALGEPEMQSADRVWVEGGGLGERAILQDELGSVVL